MDQTEDNAIHEIWQKRHKILHERRLKNKDRDAPARRSHPDLIPSWAENKFDRSGATLRNNNKITEITGDNAICGLLKQRVDERQRHLHESRQNLQDSKPRPPDTQEK